MYHYAFLKKAAMLLWLLLCCVFSSFAQELGQSSRMSAVDAGRIRPGIPFTDAFSTVFSGEGNYPNLMGQPSPEVVHRFELLDSAVVTISHCGSNFNTYLHLINSAGFTITTNNDNGPVCTGTRASIVRILAPGIYYVVSEGSGTATGAFSLSISIPAIAAQADLSDQLTTIMQHLELSRIPYGLLRDMAVEQVELNNYGGVLLGDSTLVSQGAFNSIYATLMSAKASSSAYNFQDLEVIDSLNYLNRQPGRILLSGQFFKYSAFKENAVQNNLVTVLNNQVYDKYANGLWQNPYDIKTAFAFAPSAENYQGLNQQFLMPSTFWFTNDGASINNLQLDPGDGNGYRNLAVGQSLNVLYPDTGFKNLIFKATVGGITLYSQSRIHISLSLLELFPSLSVVPITATEAFNGKFASGKMTIRLSNPQLGMRNPVIIAEGFDTGKITNPDTEFGDSDYTTFRNAVLNNSTDLNALLLNGNRDLIYVDWNGGTDDIRKNALLLKEVIRYVNSRKALSGSTSKNVIIGQSMGGLVARYALRKMEIANENHQTNLFVSFDTPHQGANLPLGFQYMAREMTSALVKTGANNLNKIISLFTSIPNYKQMLGILHSPAAKQMLINHIGPNGNMDNSTHNAWQTELAQLGYPQGFGTDKVRNVAVSNGSACDMPQQMNLNQSLLYYSGKGNTRYLGDVITRIAAPILAAFTLRPALLIGSLPGRNEIKIDLNVNATREGGNNEVYYGNIVYTKRFLWLIPIRLTIAKDRRFAPFQTLSYESYAGGFYSTGMELKNEEKQNWIFKYNITTSHQPTFGFVPVASALDIEYGPQPQDQWLFHRMYKGGAAQDYETPFANFFTAEEANESHLKITSQNGAWLSQEILNQSPQTRDCTIRCMTNNDLQGDASLICNGSEYWLRNYPLGSTITWSVTGDLAIQGSDGEETVYVVKTTANSGYGQIRVQISNDCGTVTLIKNVSINSLEPVIAPDVYHVPIGEELNFHIANPNPDWSYFWEITGPGNAFFHDPAQRYTSAVTIGVNTVGRFGLRLTVTNSCGGTGVALNDYMGTVGTPFPYRFGPNPAISSITIEHDGNKEAQLTAAKTSSDKKVPTADSDRIIEFKLMNELGKEVLSHKNKLSNKNSQLNVSGLPNGNYYLHIYDGKTTWKKQIIVKH